MGLQASIDITFSAEVNFSIIINKLQNFGWSINDQNKITYLDNEDFNWERNELIDIETIQNRLNERFINNKIIGIALSLPNLRGGLFHFLPGKNKIMILVNINRLKISGTHFTDYTFYLKKLQPVIKNCSELILTDVI